MVTSSRRRLWRQGAGVNLLTAVRLRSIKAIFYKYAWYVLVCVCSCLLRSERTYSGTGLSSSSVEQGLPQFNPFRRCCLFSVVLCTRTQEQDVYRAFPAFQGRSTVGFWSLANPIIFPHVADTAKHLSRLSSSPALVLKTTYLSAACTTALPHYSQIVTMCWYPGARDVITCYFLD